MSVGIVEYSILQYGFAVLQYIAIHFLPYCCTPNLEYFGLFWRTHLIDKAQVSFTDLGQFFKGHLSSYSRILYFFGYKTELFFSSKTIPKI